MFSNYFSHINSMSIDLTITVLAVMMGDLDCVSLENFFFFLLFNSSFSMKIIANKSAVQTT